MKARPIIFNGDMVRAILDGRKTQTRRVLKVQPPTIRHQLLHVMDSTERRQVGKSHWAVLNEQKMGVIESDRNYFTCPYGQPGDMIYVRETWGRFRGCGTMAYRATNDDNKMGDPERWTPSIHMPRCASRITLEITDVRVERLQDISERDCVSEGIGNAILRDLKKPKFAQLWESIYGAESWDANPWVWVIEFRPILKNVDEVLRGD